MKIILPLVIHVQTGTVQPDGTTALDPPQQANCEPTVAALTALLTQFRADNGIPETEVKE